MAGHFGVFSKADTRVLGTYVAKFALPALIFTALSQRPVNDILNGRYVLDYAVGSLTVFLIAFAWDWWRQGKSFTLSALCGLGMSSSNSGFVGLPIAVQVVGPASATVALAMCMAVENLLIIPLTLVMADSGHAGDGKWYRILMQSLAQLAKNPIILAIVAGFGVALLANPISGPLASTINMLALSSAAVSLFTIGGSLVGLITRRSNVQILPCGRARPSKPTPPIWRGFRFRCRAISAWNVLRGRAPCAGDNSHVLIVKWRALICQAGAR